MRCACRLAWTALCNNAGCDWPVKRPVHPGIHHLPQPGFLDCTACRSCRPHGPFLPKWAFRGMGSELAALVRTAIVVFALAAFVGCAGKWSNPLQLPGKAWMALTLSALATGAPWLCHFRALQWGEASRVAPVDKLSRVPVAVVAFVFLGGRPSAGSWLGIGRAGGGRGVGAGVQAAGEFFQPFLPQAHIHHMPTALFSIAKKGRVLDRVDQQRGRDGTGKGAWGCSPYSVRIDTVLVTR